MKSFESRRFRLLKSQVIECLLYKTIVSICGQWTVIEQFFILILDAGLDIQTFLRNFREKKTVISVDISL